MTLLFISSILGGIATVIVTNITILYYIVSRKFKYWENKKVKGPKPKFPIGNLGKGALLKSSPGDIVTDIYNEFKNEPLVGVYRLAKPVLIIRDPELVNEVTTKSFSHFKDNELEVRKKKDPLFGRNPLVLKGEEWEKVRADLAPAFASDKLKAIYPSLEETSQDMITFIDNKPEATSGEGYEIREICKRFALGNIADIALGFKGYCFNKEDSEFWTLGKQHIAPGSSFLLLNTYPFLTKHLPIRFVPKKLEAKLTSYVSKTLETREKNKTEHKDFLNSMNELKKASKDNVFTDIDIAAQVGSFIFEGYETISNTLSFALFELASNPEAQTKLREEVDRAFDENHKKIPYDDLVILPYLDGVINETLRLHPPLPVLQKVCTEPYTFELKDGPVSIDKGTPIIIPIRGLQNDPKYYQFPNTFIPDRFVRANKEQLIKHTFLPFGEGPRACPAENISVLQLKIGIAYLVHHFGLLVDKKTSLPVKYDPKNFLTTPQGGIYIDFKKLR